MSGVFQKFARKSGLASVFMATVLALPLAAGGVSPAMAEDNVADTGPDSKAAQCISNTCLAYIQTGNPEIDTMAEAGLFGLGRQLHERTGVENLYVTAPQGDRGINATQLSSGQVLPVGVDPATDDLSVYPLIYWAIDPGQASLSAEAIENLNNYMKNGGMLFIDTRDQSTFNRGKTRLQRAVDNGLNIPALKKVEGCEEAQNNCDILSKSFFLLQDFPGRFVGSDVWMERIDDEYNHDGVPRVIIGGNEWIAAWATDFEGNYLYPVVGGNSEQREYAYRVGINLVMYALTGNYKGDQVHIPAILERMGQVPQP